jgi:hypothetical protein
MTMMILKKPSTLLLALKWRYHVVVQTGGKFGPTKSVTMRDYMESHLLEWCQSREKQIQSWID